MLQLGEEALDQVPLAIEPSAEVGFRPPVGFGRDIGERSFLADGRPDAIGIIGLVRQHDCSGADVIEHVVGNLAVVTLSSGQAQPDREALPIDDRMDFGCEPASGTTEAMISIALFCRRSLLVRSDGSAVDHLDVAIMCSGDGVHHPIPHACFAPSYKAVVAGRARAIAFRQVAPRRTGTQHPEDAVQHAPVVHARHASGLVGQQRLDHAPFEVGQIISAMPTLNQTLTRSESDLLISIGVVLGTIALQPVNAAFERLTQLAGRCDFQTSPATSDLRIQLSQA